MPDATKLREDAHGVVPYQENPHEARAREQKAQKLAAYIAGETLRVLAEATDEIWNESAFRADVHPPSAETRKRVIEIMRERWDRWQR